MTKKSINILIFTTILCTSCSRDVKLDITKQLAGSNYSSLDSVINNYKKDTHKHEAALFLVRNMYDKYSYEGDIIDRYEAYFDSLQIYRKRDSIISEDDIRIKNCWDSIVAKHGLINKSKLKKRFDCQEISFDFLVRSIDLAYDEWKKKPSFADSSFNTFLEYVLPYRIGHEAIEDYRSRYATQFHMIRDTATTVKDFMNGFTTEFKYGKNRFGSNILKNYPIDISISQIEKGQYGTCRHNASYCAMVMRALGIPATVDYVPAWGNRSMGHEWGVIFLSNGGFYPFDPFFPDSSKLAYKPAKIFRQTFSSPTPKDLNTLVKEVPLNLILDNSIDVSDQYDKVFDIEVKTNNRSEKKYGIICVFDNTKWIPVWYGHIDNQKIHFNKMMGDVIYLAAIYDNNKIIPVSSPFLLNKEGEITYFSPDSNNIQEMVLKRKYPRFPRMESFALESRWARVEGSNSSSFKSKDTIYLQEAPPIDIKDTTFVTSKPYRYFRWVVQPYRRADLAEIEFYGKKGLNENEEKLTGQIFGFPIPDEYDSHPYDNAMDGNYETYYRKPKGDFGWVGIDLGFSNKAFLSRLRICPRSDTNFVIRNDEYELFMCNNEGEWISLGRQVASSDSLIYKEVPSNGLYWLRNLSRGKEERIFSYENGEQVWW